MHNWGEFHLVRLRYGRDLIPIDVPSIVLNRANSNRALILWFKRKAIELLFTTTDGSIQQKLKKKQGLDSEGLVPNKVVRFHL